MKQRRGFRWTMFLVPLLALVLVLAACGPEETPTEVARVKTETEVPAVSSPEPPTATPVPPTATPMPPTATPVPPTATPVPPTATPVPPTDTPIPPTDTPAPTPTATAIPPTDTPAPTNTPMPEVSPTPQATNTPKPTPKPKVGKILMTSNRDSWDDIYVMNDDGSGLTKLTKRGKCYDATFTPDGQTIYFEHGNDLWKMNADGSGQTNLTNSPSNLEAYPIVAPDGSRVVYTFGWPGGFEIYSMKLDGTDAKPITSRNLDITPSWSPDSQRIAFARATNTWSIWVVNRDGSGARQVTPFGPERWAISPVFSPDGKQIAFSTIADGTAWEIWVINVDGTNPHKVQGAVGNDRNNSANIVDWKQGKFLIGGWEGNWEPYFIPEAGGAPQKLLSGSKDDKPSDWWTP
ncbi:MAG: PD40 domain-containing protein [Anaerolineae bacterium]|nr:PD40 domain-containing protein [Anaerolineae bacterium]